MHFWSELDEAAAQPVRENSRATSVWITEQGTKYTQLDMTTIQRRAWYIMSLI